MYLVSVCLYVFILLSLSLHLSFSLSPSSPPLSLSLSYPMLCRGHLKHTIAYNLIAFHIIQFRRGVPWATASRCKRNTTRPSAFCNGLYNLIPTSPMPIRCWVTSMCWLKSLKKPSVVSAMPCASIPGIIMRGKCADIWISEIWGFQKLFIQAVLGTYISMINIWAGIVYANVISKG